MGTVMSTVKMTSMETVIVTSMSIPSGMVTWKLLQTATNFNGNCNIKSNGKSDVRSDNNSNRNSDSNINVNVNGNGNMNNVSNRKKTSMEIAT